MDLQQQQTDLQDIFTGRTSGAPFPRAMNARGVDHQSKRRDMKIKSTFNISFQIHFVCFVLKIFIVSWILLVVAFNLLTPWCSFLQKGRLMKLCDGDCTIKKKEIGNDVSLSSIFLEANVKMLGLILNHLRKCLASVRSWLLLRRAQVQLQSSCSETYNSEHTVYLYYTYQWQRGDTRD